MITILQENGGWKTCDKSITSLQILHDEVRKVEWNYENMLLHDYKYAPNLCPCRCQDHHFQNVWHTDLNFITSLKSEDVLSDINQVCNTHKMT